MVEPLDQRVAKVPEEPDNRFSARNAGGMTNDGSDDVPVESPPVLTEPCWRCGLSAPADADVCPHCSARSRRSRSAAAEPRTGRADEAWPLKVLVVSFAFLLLTGIVHATALDVRFGDVDELTSEIISQVWRQILLVEAIDSVIVAIAFVTLIGTPLPAFKRARGPAWVWLVSLPALAAMLALNGAYHELLRDFVRFPMIESEVRDEPSWLSFFAGCVQPAIVEEAYFRGVALSILRNYVGRHAAVWISATMFGLAHVSIALSIPYLVLFGVFVGYVRVGTGTIWLPMVLHFIHNLLVTLEEWT